MAFGPIQLVVIGFETFEPTGKILAELLRVSNGKHIRLIDLLFVRKELSGEISAAEMSDLSKHEASDFGHMLRKLMGLDPSDAINTGTLLDALAIMEHDRGLSLDDVSHIAEQIPTGGAGAVMLFEHTWAIGMQQAILQQNGRLLSQGVLTREALLLIGAELQAIQTAETVIAEATRQAAEAVEISLNVQKLAAEQAALALLQANLIEQAAYAKTVEMLVASWNP